MLNGDVPALTPETVLALVDTHRRTGAAATVLSFEPADARAYGRIVRDEDARLARIVEAADASEGELALREVNSGIYVFKGATLWPVLDRLQPHNAQGELYVTDTVALLVADGDPVAVHVAGDPFEVEGINTRAELALAAEALRDRINEEHMLAGVTIVDPASTWIDAGVEIEPDVTIQPFSVLRGPLRIASGAEIGPFAYLRPGTVVGAGAKIGTFVEVKGAHDRRVVNVDICPTSEMRRSARTRTSRRGTSPPTSRDEPGEPKGNPGSGNNGQDKLSTIRSMLLSTLRAI